jgi:hypothetical protein
MNISLIGYESLTDIDFRSRYKKKSSILYFYSTKGCIDELKIKYFLTKNGCQIIGIRKIGFLKESHQCFIKEYLEWLSQISNKKLFGSALKKWFVFDNRVSLWWLTSSSQRKKNKTILPHNMESIFLLNEIVTNLHKSKVDENILFIFDDKTNIKIAQEVFTAFARKNAVNISLDVLTKPTNTHNRLGFIKKSVENLLYLSQTWLKLIQLHIFLLETYEKEKFMTDNNTVLLISDTTDLIVDNDIYTNIYFPDIETELKARNYKLKSIYCNNNDLMNKETWHMTNNSGLTLQGGNNYHLLYPGIFSIFRVALSTVKWFLLSRVIFNFGDWGAACKFKGVNLKPLIKQDFYKLILRQASLQSYYYLCYKKLIGRLKPKAVIYRKEFNSFGRTISASAIPSTTMIGVQHGMVNNDQYGYLYRRDEIDINNASKSNFIDFCPCPDKIAVFGSRMKEYMTATGFPKSKIEVTGSLRHDKIIENYPYPVIDKKLRQKLHVKFNIPVDYFVITLCGQWAATTGIWFEMVAVALQEMDINAYLIVKPHPLELEATKTVINEFSNKLKFNDYTFITSGIADVMYVTNIAVTHSSTAGIDALLLGVPVITIHQDGLPNNNELFANSSACFEVFENDGVKSVLSKILDDKYDNQEWKDSRVQFLKYNLMNMDGKAHDRLFDIF